MGLWRQLLVSLAQVV